MRFGVLGPIEVRHGVELLPVGSGRERFVLATLLLNAGRVTLAGAMIDALWRDPPASGRAQLHNLVSSVRRRLRCADDGLIVSRPGGYELHLGSHELDLQDFRQLASRGRQAEAEGDHALAVSVLSEALSLWRGPALADVADELVAELREALHEERLSAASAMLDAELALGRNDDVLRAIPTLIAEHPYREHLHERKMLALVGAGRRAEALDHYRQVYRRFADVLGVEPGRSIGELQQRILRGEAPATIRASADSVVPRQLPPSSAELNGRDNPLGELNAPPRQLPPAVAHFTGRESQVETMIRLLERASTVAILAIAGMGGIGKTSLAVHVGHQAARLFPDGQLYLNLRGYGSGTPMPALEALSQLLTALGISRDQIPADVDQAAARYRSELAERRVLLVLDNAADIEQVAPLLPGTAGCAAIVTSRLALSALPQVHHVPLDVLSEPEALRLLAETAGLSRVHAESEAAADVVRYCGRLPLAIHLIGARLAARPSWPIAHLAERLADEHRRLDELERGNVSVRASFAVSIDQLAESQDPTDRLAAVAYCLVGLPDGPDISTPVAERLLDLAERDAERTMERLADLHLLEPASPGRYRLHDLLSVYARERAADTVSDHDRASAITRVVELYAAVAWRSMRLINPNSTRQSWADERWTAVSPTFRDSNEAFTWLDAHRPHLINAARQAAATPGVAPKLAVRLALGLFSFYVTRGHWQDWTQVGRAALAAASTGSDRLADAMVRMDLGLALADLAHAGSGRYQEGLANLRQSLTEFEALGERAHMATCLTNLSHILEQSGQLDEAITCAERSLAINRALTNHYGEATICGSLGDLYGKTGDRQRELSFHQKSLMLSERNGHAQGMAQGLQRVGVAHRQNGRHQDALTALRRSTALFQQIGDPLGQAASLNELGKLSVELGDHTSALESLTDGLVLAREYGDRRRQASLLHHIGTALMGLARRREAREHWQSALTLYEQHGLPASEEIRQLLNDSPTTP